MTSARDDAFHPELRAGRWIPRIGLGPRTLRFARITPRAQSSTAEVRASTVRVKNDRFAQTARVFEPTGSAPHRPAVFWIHGGGMVMGTPTFDDQMNIMTARELGATVFAPSYRLSPEHPAPAAVDDVHTAFHEFVRRASEFGVDPARIAVSGGSAGGGLAAALVNRLHDEGGIQPVFQALVYPMLDDRTTLRRDIDGRRLRVWTLKSNEFGWRSYLGQTPGSPGISDDVVPARRSDLSGLPSTWIGVGTRDLFHDEDVDYARRLREAGVPCELEVVAGAFHAFDGLFARTEVARRFTASRLRAIGAAFTRA